MKEKIIPIILLAFVVWSAQSFSTGTATVSSGIDNLRYSFSSIEDILPADANISLKSVDVDSAFSRKIFYFIRFALAPRYVSPDANEYDTVLTVFGRLPNKQKYYSVVRYRKILWVKKGIGSYLFILTSGNAGR